MGFLINIFHRYEHYKESIGNDEGHLYSLYSKDLLPLPLSVADFWKKNFYSKTAKQYAYFIDTFCILYYGVTNMHV